MARKYQKEYEIRTIDQYGDVIDIVWSEPNTKAGYARAMAKMPTYIEGDAVAVVIERTTFISDIDGVGLDDLDYSDTLAWAGDETALSEGGWIE